MVGASWLLLRDRPPQREVVDAVHRIFPTPVPMIDQFHTVGSFPKRGFFMSTWGMSSYRKGRPVFADILRRDTVPLLLVDGQILGDAVGSFRPPDPRWRAEHALYEEDRSILAQNYLPYWGPIWIAGQQFDRGSPQEFEILIPGRYRLEGQAVSIDGMAIADGGLVSLARRAHRFDAPITSHRTLRWAAARTPPPGPAPEGNLFSPFFDWAARPQSLPDPVQPASDASPPQS
jgi:hypothetical protein